MAVNTVRRSVAIPRKLAEEVLAVSPPEIGANLNRLVIASLQAYLESKREEAFEKAMAEMAADPQIQRECAAIAEEFLPTELDGLPRD